jgi:hypothetical protein
MVLHGSFDLFELHTFTCHETLINSKAVALDTAVAGGGPPV